MEKSVRHFVGRILGIHFLLLALLLALVSLGARHVYQSAREQAMDQARERQTLMATQTAHGVAGFYDSILSDLGLLKPEDEVSDLPSPPSQSEDPRPLANIGSARQAAGMLLARQLRGRAQLFIADDQLHLRPLGTDDRAARPAPTGKGTKAAPAVPPVAVFSQAYQKEIVSRFGSWLVQQNENAISGIQVIDVDGAKHAVKLVCVPMAAPKPGPRVARKTWLVAVVPALPIEHSYLSDLREYDVSGAFLVDESMTIMAASDHKLVGTHIDLQTAPALIGVLQELNHGSYIGTRPLARHFEIAGQRYDPAMLTACPLNVMGKSWFVLVASPLSKVDGVVRDLSRKGLFWAIFVAISMTAILVSTATQLIFSRMRMERVRHRLLQNEMRQARQIQLAWLPQKTKTICSASAIEIASLNRPATHISGDFYNFWELPDGRTAVVIGDVTGHGTAAAFLMATTQLLIRNTLPQFCDPGRCLDEVNQQLTSQVFNGQFVTMQVLVIDPRNGEVAIATAGHPAPLLNDNGVVNPMPIEPQLVAGVDRAMHYPTERFRLPIGSTLLLYTDGVVETEDPAGNRLRLDGLRDALAGGVENAEALLQKAVSAVNTFRRGRDLADDLTLVAVHLHAPNLDQQPMDEPLLPAATVQAL